MRILAYIRVSTDSQVDSGAGLNAQIEACDRYVSNQGLTIHEMFKDEGISGSKIEERAGLMRLLNELQKDDILLVAKRDRLARDRYAFAYIEKVIEKKRARIISVAGEGTEQDDPAGRMLSGIIDVFAVYERDVIRARTKAALTSMKNQGKRVGHIPFGYKLADDRIHIEDCLEEQDIIRQMKELQADGLSIRDIAKALNERQAFNRGQSQWNHGSVHRLLKKAA